MVEPWLIAGVLVVATIYSMVGHGGASGYLALLAFTAIPATLGSTTALVLNVVVAGITLFVFQRARHFEWRLALPLLATSVPFAFVGGMLRFENHVRDLILAFVLVLAAFALGFSVKKGQISEKGPARGWLATAGAGIGLLSGIVGVGGGIFLSPLMILFNWAETRKVAAISSVFILMNSIAGLAARPSDLVVDSLDLWPLIVAGSIGAIAGSLLGARRVSSTNLRRALALVLLIAVFKLVQRALGL